MPKFTADQLQEIAQCLNDIGNSVAQVRLDAIHDGRPLNDPQIVQLLGLSLSLSNQASSFALQAAELTLDNTDAAVNVIQGATREANKALQKLAQLDRAINIAAAVIVLATAIFTADPKQIANAAKGVYDAATAESPDDDAKEQGAISPG